MRVLAAVPLGAGGTCHGAGGRWRGLAGLRADASSRRLAAWTASGRAAALWCTQWPGPMALGTPVAPHSNIGDGPPPTGTQSSPAPQQGTTVPRTGAVPGVPAERRSTGIQPTRPASSVARWTPPRPASWAAWVRHEKPSARYTASGFADRDGSSEWDATATDRS